MMGDDVLRLNCSALYCVALHCIVLHSISLGCSTVLCCAMLCIAVHFIILIITKITDIKGGQLNDGQPCVLFRYNHFDLSISLPPCTPLHSHHSLTSTLYNSNCLEYHLSFSDFIFSLIFCRSNSLFTCIFSHFLARYLRERRYLH